MKEVSDDWREQIHTATKYDSQEASPPLYNPARTKLHSNGKSASKAMDGHSISSLTTLCSGISQRAISSANEIQSLVEPLDSSQHSISQPLSSLASALEELNQRASQLDVCLITSTVAMQVQDAFKELLTTCDGTMTVLHKQLMRLQPDNIESVNMEFLVAYYQTVKANSKLLETMFGIVKM